MEKNKDITELDVYRDALLFSNLIWKICLSWNYFEQKTIGIQLVRAADSISANIAEGFGRFYLKESKQFYRIALGSLNEARSDIHLCLFPCAYITKEEHDKLIEQTNITAKLVQGLVASAKKVKRESK